MSELAPRLASGVGSRERAPLLARVVLVVAAFAAYANSFRVPFVFDDIASIVDNPTIRSFGTAFSPPRDWGFTVSGRPVLNLSLALNHAISGVEAWSYHALNLLIHTLAGLVLFGLVRRTLARPPLAARFGEKALPLAWSIALVWVLHPLQTESVTYTVQRAESLMGLFFLTTLYGFLRAVDSPNPARWMALSFGACLLGVGTKEVAVLAPVLVYLYDRTFVSGSFLDAWRWHGRRHLLLVVTWLPLAWLLLATGGNRGGTSGFNVGVSAVGYWLTQFEAVVRYLSLSFWPHPLVFDYGKIPPPGIAGVLPWVVPVVALLATTVVALWRWPVAGFLGAWFFALLAPTSVVPGTLQMIVEHRMYLPLAAVVALVFGLLARYCQARVLWGAAGLCAVVLGTLTWQRNTVYLDERKLWADALVHRPGNARAHNNLGLILYRAGRFEEAIAHDRDSVRLDPGVAQAHYNLGLALMKAGRPAEAVAPLREAARILPHYYDAYLNLGIVLTALGRPAEALVPLDEAIRLASAPAEAHLRRGIALAALERWPEAVEHYAQTLRLAPTYAEAHSNWGVALFRMGKPAEAMEHFNAALRLKADLPDVHFNLGLAGVALGRPAEAIPHFEAALRLDPAHVEARLNLGIALGQAGRLPEALGHLTEAARLRPDSPQAHANLGTALAAAGRDAEALPHYEAALRLQPDNPQANYNVGYALFALGRGREAQRHFENALRLRPDFSAAYDMLRRVRQRAAP